MTEQTCGSCAHYSASARPGENKTPTRGGWCLAPVPAWAVVSMNAARVSPDKGRRCPAFVAIAPAVDPRQTTLLGEEVGRG